MSNKRGRPKGDNSKDCRLEVRMSMGEQQMVERIAEITGETKSDVVRKALMDYYLTVLR